MIEDIKPDTFYGYASRIASGDLGHYFYSLHEDYFYFYENGYWHQLNDIQFLGEIQRKIIQLIKFPISMRRQVIDNFKHLRYLKLEELNKSDLINFENYMFDPIGNNVLAHKPEYYSTIRIPYKYDVFSDCKIWLKTLNEIFENDNNKIELLQEFIGYCLTGENEQKKALLLLGDTDTGKSTIIDICRALIGDVNCSNVPLQYLSNPQYTPLLINKMVNIDPEVNKNAMDYEREFKLITGGKKEKVSCNQKHIPTFEFTPRCKLLLSANIFPKITDHSSAFYQRLFVIPCNRRFMEHEKNRKLDEELKKELPGIFNWACQGLWRLRKRGRFNQYDFIIESIQELEDENNPSNTFFEEHIEIEMGAYIEKGELYERYKTWSERTKNYALSQNRFSVAVYKKYQMQTPKNARVDNVGKRIWKNIKYVDIKSYVVKEEVNWQDLPPAVGITDNAPPSLSKQGDIDWEK